MIELSLEMCNDMTEIINSKDYDLNQTLQNEFREKYNILFDDLQDIVNDSVELDYIENHVYHLVPIITSASLFVNAIIYAYLQKNASI
jgi:hypothetical protein